jgi:hypothetical protein
MGNSENFDTLCNTPISNNVRQSGVVTQQKGIYFKITTGTPVSCGIICRQIMTTLTNTGDKNAHNVKVNLYIYNNIEDIVYSTQEQLGDVKSGQSVSKSIIMNLDCGSVLTLYSKCRKHMPLVLKLTVIFDEGIQAFPDYVYNTKF